MFIGAKSLLPIKLISEVYGGLSITFISEPNPHQPTDKIVSNYLELNIKCFFVSGLTASTHVRRAVEPCSIPTGVNNFPSQDTLKVLLE